MVVDEKLSMVDALLFESLLRALKNRSRLILVGMPTSSRQGPAVSSMT